jgi:hypothetical protein
MGLRLKLLLCLCVSLPLWAERQNVTTLLKEAAPQETITIPRNFPFRAELLRSGDIKLTPTNDKTLLTLDCKSETPENLDAAFQLVAMTPSGKTVLDKLARLNKDGLIEMQSLEGNFAYGGTSCVGGMCSYDLNVLGIKRTLHLFPKMLPLSLAIVVAHEGVHATEGHGEDLAALRAREAEFEKKSKSKLEDFSNDKLDFEEGFKIIKARENLRLESEKETLRHEMEAHKKHSDVVAEIEQILPQTKNYFTVADKIQFQVRDVDENYILERYRLSRLRHQRNSPKRSLNCDGILGKVPHSR